VTTTSRDWPATDPVTVVALARQRPGGWWLTPLGWLSWIVPTLVTGLVVRYQAARPQLWRDEFASWSVASRTVPQILDLGKHIDGVTVPYYLFLHYWIGWFGDSVPAMRAPSIIAMAAAAGVAAMLGRRLYGDLAGLFAGLLFAGVPAVTRYGQEVRGYAAATLFTVLATLLLVVALQRSRWWTWIPYAISVALIGLSHEIALLVLAGHLVAVLTMCRREGRLRLLWWVLAAGAGAGALAPIALNGLGQHGAQLSWLGPATLDDLVDQPGNIFTAPVVGGAIWAIAAFALPRRREHWQSDGWTRLLWLTVLIPFAALYAIDQLITPIFLGRYLLFLIPMLCVLAGRALTTLRPHTALAVILAVAAVGVPAQKNARESHSPFDYRAVASLLRTWSQPGDGVIYAPRSGWQFTDEAMRYYLGDRQPKDVLLKSDEVRNASLWATECDPGPDCTAGTSRVWTVIADDTSNSGQAAVLRLSASDKDALSTYRRAERWRVGGFTVYLYVAK
jgi:mannosyltransferase